MKKILLLLISCALYGADAKNERIITINNATKDVTEHIMNYLNVVDPHAIDNQPQVLQSPTSKVAPASWGLSSLIFGAPKMAKKEIPHPTQSTLKDLMKVYRFDHQANGPFFKEVISFNDFLNENAGCVHDGNFSVYNHSDWNDLSSDEKWMTYIFIGAKAKQAPAYYFAQAISNLMEFNSPAYYAVLVESVANAVNKHTHSQINNSNILPYLFKYLRARKKESSKCNFKENQLLKKIQLIQYTDGEQLSHRFKTIDSLDAFKESHLADLLQGKFYIYDTSERDESYSSSFSKVSSRSNSTKIFIGEGLDELTPHNFFVDEMRLALLQETLLGSAI